MPRLCLFFVCTIYALLGFSQAYEEMTDLVSFSNPGRNHGIAINDFNGDGLDDIYVSRREGNNKFYINKGSFHFDEKSEEFAIDYAGDTNMSLWLDYDNDNDMDLLLGNKFEEVILYRNDGDQFTDVTLDLNLRNYGNLRSLNTADIDNDGDLDIYIANVGKENALFINNGDEGFENVIETCGITDDGSSMGAVFFDYNNDGLIDLYQTRDGNQGNLLFENIGSGKFLDVSKVSKTDYEGFGMGVDVGDINNDGYLDLYITNLYDNVLYLNNGQGKFINMAEGQPVSDVGMGWGTMLIDANNDGLKDIYVSNESSFPVNQEKLPNQLFINEGNMVFSTQDYMGSIQSMYSSYGSAFADFDNDGQQDLVIANSGSDGNQIFRNMDPVEGYYIGFNLIGKESNSKGIGSRVEIFYKDEYQSDIVTAGSGYASQNTSKMMFGLKDFEGHLDKVIIHWPSGIQQVIRGLEINTIHDIEETKSITSFGPVVWSEPLFPNQLDDVTIYFDAAQGNGALSGFSGEVFAHTGLITNESTSSTDWKNVIGNWGTNDARTLMTNEGNDIFSISYNVEAFYNIMNGTEAEKLAFVFRNEDGSVVGRDADGSDIFLDLYSPDESLLLNVISPSPSSNTIYTLGDSILVDFRVNVSADVTVSDNGNEIFNAVTTSETFYNSPIESGEHSLEIVASDGTSSALYTFDYIVIENNSIREDPPVGTKPGLNYVSGSSYIFQLVAPQKRNVFLLCPSNNFEANSNYQLKQSNDGNIFWIELPKTLFENNKNVYQYLVDGAVVIADPYSEVVLDPSNDQWVDSTNLINLPPYPGEANGIVTVFDLNEDEFDWRVENFEAPEKSNLVIYELLMRDFLGDKQYTSLIDTLDYLERLGVNAIELMPIQEFEGNQSWGYNPSFHMAVDKYYGSKESLKRFIDEAHLRGIAVILDVVFNHAFSQSPLAQLYWDSANFRPAADNPWLNVTAKHPFNVGYDFNHESSFTKDWVKQVCQHWIEAYKMDGFRFDLSKGFTQMNSGNDAGLMSQYDASRIAILKDYADFIWSVDDDSYVMLEHFADNSEETELANYGMMLWGNMNHQFIEAGRGKKSELEWADYKVRGWNEPNLISYMESHDEERLMYRILEAGDMDGTYNTRELNTALDRVAAATTLFLSIPGPKMFWQFGELGYDYSINRCTNGSISPDCRLDPKPIKWDYKDNYYRQRLFDVVAKLTHLKTNYPTFSTTDYTFSDANFYIKTVHLNHSEMDAVSMVNFRITSTEINPKFQSEGTWYEYFSGDSVVVSNVNEKLPFQPGEFRIYTSKRITPPNGFLSSNKEVVWDALEVFPNPVSSGQTFHVNLSENVKLESVDLISIDGKVINLMHSNTAKRIDFLVPYDVSSGMYYLRLKTQENVLINRLVVE